jgi:acetyl esterase/lipase
MRKLLLVAMAGGLLLGLVGSTLAEDPKPAGPVPEAPAYTRTEDVIYARKFGTALTMDVLTPKKNANGAAVVVVVSGGGSAGGHLSLMQGTAGDQGDPKATEPVERVSSRVQAVACFFPPTDFLNYGGTGKYAFARDGLLADFRVAMDVREFDPRTKLLERVTDEKKILELARKVSPLTHVSADDPPTLIIHGDEDKLVPIAQAEAIVAKLKEVGVLAVLVTKKGAGHGWAGIDKDIPTIADWFDKHLGHGG